MDSYIDNLISQSKDGAGKAHCDKASIIGLDGSAWTTSSHPNALVLTATERATIARCFTTLDFSSFQAQGINAAGVKYQFIREDGNVVIGKKSGSGALTLQTSKTAIVIGHTIEGGTQGYTNKGVGVIADYLASIGQ